MHASARRASARSPTRTRRPRRARMSIIRIGRRPKRSASQPKKKAPNGRAASVRKMQLGHRLDRSAPNSLADRRQHEHHQEEVERVERPAEIGGPDRAPLLRLERFRDRRSGSFALLCQLIDAVAATAASREEGSGLALARKGSHCERAASVSMALAASAVRTIDMKAIAALGDRIRDRDAGRPRQPTPARRCGPRPSTAAPNGDVRVRTAICGLGTCETHWVEGRY